MNKDYLIGMIPYLSDGSYKYFQMEVIILWLEFMIDSCWKLSDGING